MSKQQQDNQEQQQQALADIASKVAKLQKTERKNEVAQLLVRIQLGAHFLTARKLHALDPKTRPRDPGTGKIIRSSPLQDTPGFTSWLMQHSTVSRGQSYRCIAAAQYFGLTPDEDLNPERLNEIKQQILDLAKALEGAENVWPHVKNGLPDPDKDKDPEDTEPDPVAAKVKDFVTAISATADTIIEEAEALDILAGRRKRDKELSAKAKQHGASRLLAALEHITGETFDTSRAKKRKYQTIEHPDLADL